MAILKGIHIISTDVSGIFSNSSNDSFGPGSVPVSVHFDTVLTKL